MPQDRRRDIRRFPVTRVSHHFHRHIQALEAACVAAGEAETLEDAGLAHKNISLAREALYQYVEELESRDRDIERAVALRF